MKPANVLHIPTLSTDWCDADHIMLHACFTLLVDVVENEQILAYTDFSNNRALEAEIIELYTWWKSYSADMYIDDDAEEQDMLLRLIKIRKTLWV